MAAIDKSLPNEVRTNIKLPNPQEVQQEQQQQVAGDMMKPVDIQNNEDGSVDINFDPNAVNPGDTKDHFSNLAELLPDSVLDPLAHELYNNYQDYKTSRKDWERAYTSGLDLLGFNYDDRTEPFKGASGATHPVLAEAVTQFQSLAYKELLPSGGPVRTQIVGMPTPQKEQQAIRVKDYMNYQVMTEMKEYEAEFDQMLFYLPLAGSSFKKVYYDALMQRAVSKFVPADDLVVPYTATSLDDCEAIIHSVRMSENELRKQQVGGFYRDIEVNPAYMTETELQKKERELEGVSRGREERMYTILECHVNIDLEGFEDVNPQDGEFTGIKLPYIVTLEEGTRKILSIRRNFDVKDPKKARIEHFVHFKFLPGLGFYGFGLIHMIGGLSRTATAALRQLLDAGTLANLPAGFKMRGIKMRDEAQAIQPGEFRDVDAPGGSLKDAFMPLPFKEPSATLLQLMGVVVQAGQRFASIADLQVGEGNQQAAVGTTVALLERGSRTMSAIHKRLYAAMKREFTLLSRVFKLYLPPVYPYDVVGGQRQIMQTDFDSRIDILPVADPNIFSQTQRISLAQTELQLASSNPRMHNQYEVYRNMYEALGVPDVQLILPPPPPKPTPLDPAVENSYSLQGKPFQVFPQQDQEAHIRAHRAFMSSLLVKSSPPTLTIMQGHVSEHVSHMARAIVDQETQEEIQSVAQQYGGQLPPELQQQFQAELEKKVAQKIAEITEQMVGEEQEMMDTASQDPLVDLKNKEITIRAEEAEQKAHAAGEKQALEEKKAKDNVKIAREKIDSQEDIADQRAETQREKMQQMERQSKKKEK